MENPEICSICCGTCCKLSAGHIFPSEINQALNKEYLSGLIKTKLYAFDWWGNSPFDTTNDATRLFYLRYKQIGTTRLLDNSRNSPCILLAENGCMLEYEQRPEVCRALEPSIDFQCNYENDNLSKINCAIAWMPYQTIIIELIRENNEF